MKSTYPNIACIKFLVFYLLQVCILTTCSKTFLPQTAPKAVETHTESSQSQRTLTGEFPDPIEKQLAKALVEKNFHGDWHFANSSSYSNATFNFFQHQEGILKISTSRTPEDEYIIDLLLVDGSNTDHKFLILSFHQNIFAKTLNKETSSFQLRDYPITYRKGDNFFTFTGFADKLQEVAKCSLNAVTFSFWNAEKNKPFEVSQDKMKDMRVKIGIESKDCGLEIEGMLVQNYGKKFHYQIWLYLALVGFCILSQVIGLIVHKNALNLEFSLPHRFQLSFIITLNLQFVKMNLMFFGEYLYDFSRAWVFLLVALGFFSVFLLEMRILFMFVRDDQSPESYSWGPFAGIGLFVCFLMFNSDYYWILYPYIMTPLMDILQSYTCSKRWNYSFAFYFGYLLPYLPLIGYFKWYQGNFARFSPAPPVFHWCSFLIFFGLTWLIVRTIIKKFYPRAGEPQFKVIETYDGELDDCAICLEQLKLHEDKKLSLEDANTTGSQELSVLSQEKIEKNSKKPSCEKILQTPCGHFFHKRCLKKWIQQKAVCPLCSRETPDSV